MILTPTALLAQLDTRVVYFKHFRIAGFLTRFGTIVYIPRTITTACYAFFVIRSVVNFPVIATARDAP